MDKRSENFHMSNNKRPSMKNSKSRIAKLARWSAHSDTGLKSRVEVVHSTSAFDKIKIANSDPRDRTESFMIERKYARAIALKLSDMNNKPWSHRISAKPLTVFYESLSRIIGKNITPIANRSDLLIDDLFALLQTKDTGLKLRLKGSRQAFKIDNAAELAFFMERALADINLAQLAKSMFGSVATINSLQVTPENNRMTSLFRVLDQLNVEVTAYDRTLEYTPRAPAMA